MPATAKKPAKKSSKKSASKRPTKSTGGDPVARPTAPEKRDDRFELVPLEQIVESHTNPRRVFKEMEQMADSIRARGVLEPVLLRRADAYFIEPGKSGNKPGFFILDKRLVDGQEYMGNMEAMGFFKTRAQAEAAFPKYELVAGARRLRGSKMAGKPSIPAIIRTLTDDEALEMQLIENNNRVDPDPLDEAAGFKAYLDRGHAVPELAAKIGRDETYIYRRLKLMDLIEPYQKALAEGVIQYAHAVELSRLPKEFQEELNTGDFAIESFKYNGVPTVKDLHGIIKAEFDLDLSKAAFSLDDVDLVEAAGSCVACPKRSGFNPALFPEIGKKDVCLDKACFENKRSRYIQISIKKAEAESGTEVVKISKQNSWTQRTTLGTDDYEIVSKKQAEKLPAKKMRTGVIVDGTGAGKTVLIKVKRELQKKKSGGSRGSQQESYAKQQERWEKERQKKQELADAQSKVRMAVARRIVSKVSGKLTLEVMRITGMVLMYAGSGGAIAEILGWEQPKKAGHDWIQKHAHKAVPEMSEEELHRLFVTADIGHDATCRYHQDLEFPAELKKIAKRYDVDVAAIIAETKEPEKPVAAKVDGDDVVLLEGKAAAVSLTIRESNGEYSGSIKMRFGKGEVSEGALENGQIYPSEEKIKIAAADVAEKWFMNLLEKYPHKRKELTAARDAMRDCVKRIHESAEEFEDAGEDIEGDGDDE